MKYFVSSDVHGFFDQWQKALKGKGFDKTNPEHCLINLGDLFDRGSQNKECLEWVMSVPNKILIRGNHEDLLEELLRGRTPQSHDYSNGTIETIFELDGGQKFLYQDAFFTVSHSELLWNYLNECKDYAKIGTNIFVHGWIPDKELENLDTPSSYSWKEARWLNGMQMWDWGSRIEGYTIWCGHWHVTWGRANIDECSNEWPSDDSAEQIAKLDWSPWKKEGIVAMDGCTALSGIVNVEVFEL